jgi:hypothetical protein
MLYFISNLHLIKCYDIFLKIKQDENPIFIMLNQIVNFNMLMCYVYNIIYYIYFIVQKLYIYYIREI